MKTGLLSIHAQYADAILGGTKRYEFRKKAPRLEGPTRFLIYIPGSRKELVGEMVVTGIISMHPRDLWEQTREHAGISKEAFMTYFHGREVAHALVIGGVTRFEQPKHLDEIRRTAPGGFWPPQFLQWVSPALLAALLA